MWFAKSTLEDSCDTWTQLIKIKMKKDENIVEFIRRYESLEIKLKSLQIQQKDRVLAIHLLNSTTLSPKVYWLKVLP